MSGQMKRTKWLRDNVKSSTYQNQKKKKMKQLDVDVSPPAFLWDPHLNLAMNYSGCPWTFGQKGYPWMA